MKEACVQANIYKKDDYQLKTCTTCECVRKLAKKYYYQYYTFVILQIFFRFSFCKDFGINVWSIIRTIYY